MLLFGYPARRIRQTSTITPKLALSPPRLPVWARLRLLVKFLIDHLKTEGLYFWYRLDQQTRSAKNVLDSLMSGYAS